MDRTVGPPDDAPREEQILHDAERDRFEVLRGPDTIAVLQYEDTPAGAAPDGSDGAGDRSDRSVPTVRDLRSTIVSPDAGGQGVGSRLVRAVLDDARAQGLSVTATCWFARGWIDRHPDYQDLLAAGTEGETR
jgi:GNAT superfamily N-acetyltransferase